MTSESHPPQPNPSTGEQTKTRVPGKIADPAALISFVLAVLALTCALAMFWYVNELEDLGPLLFTVIGFSAASVALGAAGLRLQSRYRVWSRAAIGIAAPVLVLFIVIVILGFIKGATG